MDHGYFIYPSGNGPLRSLPIAWFAFQNDALAWVRQHSGEIRPAERDPKKKKVLGDELP